MRSNPAELQKTIEALATNSRARIAACEDSLALFTFCYLPHYITSSVPDFHWDIFDTLTDWEGSMRDAGVPDAQIVELMAFRGGAKSTIGALAFVLWHALFRKSRFIIPIGDTHAQAKQHIANVISELESNTRIRADFGDLRNDNSEEWTATNVVLKNGVRIMARSRGQKVRGLRHLQYRPDLIIADDIENADDVREPEQRQKTDEWFWGDVFPAIEPKVGKVVVIGSLLHSDGFMARLKQKIQQHGVGILREYPLLAGGEPDGACVWPDRFPTERIEQLKVAMRLPIFMREMLLKVVPDEGRLVKRVGYYDAIPPLVSIAIGVDLAISKKLSADMSAINVAGRAEDGKVYNLAHITDRWNFNELLTKVHTTFEHWQQREPQCVFQVGVEDVAYQKAAIEEMTRRFTMPVVPVKQMKDKRARLETHLPYLENDTILFPRNGFDTPIMQMLNFGTEKHDDSVDAMEISWRLLVEEPRAEIAWA